MGIRCSLQQVDLYEEFHSTYKLGKKLDEGGFGQVFAALDRKTGKEVAVKVMRNMRVNEELHQAYQESNLWSVVVGHKHVVVLHKQWIVDDVCYIVMERCRHSLWDRMKSQKQWGAKDLWTDVRAMLTAIHYVHSCGVVHRDVKPANFLYDMDDTVKLSDFGLSCRYFSDSIDYLEDQVGCAPFMSPELLNRRGYGKKTDIWSFGVTVYLLLFAGLPYIPAKGMNSRKAIKAAIKKPEHPPLYDVAPREEAALKTVPVPSGRLRREFTPFSHALLDRNASTRVTAEQALRLRPLSWSLDRLFEELACDDGGMPHEWLRVEMPDVHALGWSEFNRLVPGDGKKERRQQEDGKMSKQPSASGFPPNKVAAAAEEQINKLKEWQDRNLPAKKDANGQRQRAVSSSVPPRGKPEQEQALQGRPKASQPEGYMSTIQALKEEGKRLNRGQTSQPSGRAAGRRQVTPQADMPPLNVTTTNQLAVSTERDLVSSEDPDGEPSDREPSSCKHPDEGHDPEFIA